MTSKQRIQSFAKLGLYLNNKTEDLQVAINQAVVLNPWFNNENCHAAFKALAKNLDSTLLEEWMAKYNTNTDGYRNKTVGLVLAGNIPMVGFHDILCSLLLGFNVQIKLSSDDKILIPFLLNKLQEINPLFEQQISIVDRLNNFDIIIATGSNNTSRYFEYYFKKYPHIIRKNRNGVAVVTGEENKQELKDLSSDIFTYFGLGCRNVSKIYFPKNYHYPTFFEGIEESHPISNHFKYNNNYDYNKSIYLINGDEHLDNGFLLLKKDTRLASPLAVVYYEEYETLDEVKDTLERQKNEIQCIVSSINLGDNLNSIPFGKSQSPKLSDYADGVDVIEFLLEQL